MLQRKLGGSTVGFDGFGVGLLSDQECGVESFPFIVDCIVVSVGTGFEE
jgi:hypothetical protein